MHTHELDHSKAPAPRPHQAAGQPSVRLEAGLAGLTPAALLHLQRVAGNESVGTLLGSHKPPAAAGLRVIAHEPAHVVQRAQESAELEAEQPAQRSIWDTIGDVAGSVWGGVKEAASAAWGGISGVASDLWEGAKSLGSEALGWLKSAGSAVWSAIKWFGSKSWTVIKAIGMWGWEKLSLLGTLVWSFISNLPERLWRLVVDAWDGITGVLGWLWTGLKGLAGGAWDALVGVFSWLGSGLSGALSWLGDGLAAGEGWMVDFISSPSADKLLDGLLGALSWAWSGMKDLGQWSWQGLVAAGKWAWSGLKAFGEWLWDGALQGLIWCGEVLLHLLEVVGVGEALELLWGLIFRLRPLTTPEVTASLSVHAAGQIPYGLVRVDDDSYLIRIGTALATLFKTKVSPGAITTMHIIHAPSGGLSLDTAVHELTHVAQYEKVGAIYMPEALHAQGSVAGYNYGNLPAATTAGKHYEDFNREQQAAICEDFYRVNNGMPPLYGGTVAGLTPFIAEMRAGRF